MGHATLSEWSLLFRQRWQWLTLEQRVLATLSHKGIPLGASDAQVVWRNSAHMHQVCEDWYGNQPETAIHATLAKMTILLNTYSASREKLLLELVHHYSAMTEVVAEIIIVWHDPSAQSIARRIQFEHTLAAELTQQHVLVVVRQQTVSQPKKATIVSFVTSIVLSVPFPTVLGLCMRTIG